MLEPCPQPVYHGPSMAFVRALWTAPLWLMSLAIRVVGTSCSMIGFLFMACSMAAGVTLDGVETLRRALSQNQGRTVDHSNEDLPDAKRDAGPEGPGEGA